MLNLTLWNFPFSLLFFVGYFPIKRDECRIRRKRKVCGALEEKKKELSENEDVWCGEEEGSAEKDKKKREKCEGISSASFEYFSFFSMTRLLILWVDLLEGTAVGKDVFEVKIKKNTLEIKFLT